MASHLLIKKTSHEASPNPRHLPDWLESAFAKMSAHNKGTTEGQADTNEGGTDEGQANTDEDQANTDEKGTDEGEVQANTDEGGTDEAEDQANTDERGTDEGEGEGEAVTIASSSACDEHDEFATEIIVGRMSGTAHFSGLGDDGIVDTPSIKAEFVDPRNKKAIRVWSDGHESATGNFTKGVYGFLLAILPDSQKSHSRPS